MLGGHAAPRVFPAHSVRQLRHLLEGLCARAGVEYARRHTAGTKRYEETRDLLEVKEHLRHASVTSTEIYMDYASQRKRSEVRDW